MKDGKSRCGFDISTDNVEMMNKLHLISVKLTVSKYKNQNNNPKKREFNEDLKIFELKFFDWR
jgi:hypothetical protein